MGCMSLLCGTRPTVSTSLVPTYQTYQIFPLRLQVTTVSLMYHRHHSHFSVFAILGRVSVTSYLGQRFVPVSRFVVSHCDWGVGFTYLLFFLSFFLPSFL